MRLSYFFPSCRLLLLISEQGTILDRSWRQLREYDSQATQVIPWLNKAEDTLARYMAHPVKSDPTAIKQQITELKVPRNDHRVRFDSCGLQNKDGISKRANESKIKKQSV